MSVRISAPHPRLATLVDICIVLLYFLFLWAPWDRGAQTTPTTLTWLLLPVTLARHGVGLNYATEIVTLFVLAIGAAGALLSIAGRMRGSAPLWAAGAWLFGASVAILMPLWTAVGFLGALLLVLALRARFVQAAPLGALPAMLLELWPVAYTVAFAVLAWRYNPQLLLKALLIALGASLVARALVPATPPAAGALPVSP
jgi:hypothetical protein